MHNNNYRQPTNCICIDLIDINLDISKEINESSTDNIDTVDNNNSNILIAVSQNGGRNYSQPVNLSSHTDDPIKSINPQVGAFGDDVYIAWQGVNMISGKSQVYLVNSTDGGTTFGKAMNISKNPQANVSEYTLLVDKDTGKVLIGWIDDTGPNNYCGARC